MTLRNASVAFGLLLLLSLGEAQGASAEGSGSPQAEPVATPNGPESASASAPASSENAPPDAASTGSAPRRFIPTEQVSEDRAVAFPKDI